MAFETGQSKCKDALISHNEGYQEPGRIFSPFFSVVSFKNLVMTASVLARGFVFSSPSFFSGVNFKFDTFFRGLLNTIVLIVFQFCVCAILVFLA